MISSLPLPTNQRVTNKFTPQFLQQFIPAILNCPKLDIQTSCVLTERDAVKEKGLNKLLFSHVQARKSRNKARLLNRQLFFVLSFQYDVLRTRLLLNP